MPNAVCGEIEALQMNPAYKFDEVPMPYDLTLNIKGVKTLEAKYDIVAARQNTPLTETELAAIADAGSVRDVQREFQKAAAEKESGGHQEPVITEEAPFPTEPPPAGRSTDAGRP